VKGGCVQAVGNVPIGDQGEHLRELRAGYGDVDPEGLLDAMVRQQTLIVVQETANLDDPGLSPVRRAHARTAIDWATASRALVHDHRALLLGSL
jgi:hypothetical protein